MNLELDEQQRAIQDAFRSLFAKEARPERVRAVQHLGFDADLWAKLGHLEVPGMALSPAHGGSGATMVDLALVAEQAGHCVAPVPLVDTWVAARALERLGRADAVASDGATIGGFAVRAGRDGQALLVPSGSVADVVLALDGTRLVLAHPAGDRRPLPNLGRLPLRDVDLAGAEVLLDGPPAVQAHALALDDWCVLTASMVVGCAAAGVELAVAYVKQRKAFGVPLATFQAVAHGLADAATDIEGARILARKAAWAIDAGDPRARELARMSFFLAAEVAERATAAAVHFHGGYGVMLEYDVHLFARAAKAWSLVWGDRATCLDQVADDMLGPIGAGRAVA